MDALIEAIADVLGRTTKHVTVRLVPVPLWVVGLVLLVIIALVLTWIVVDRRRHHGRRD